MLLMNPEERPMARRRTKKTRASSRRRSSSTRRRRSTTRRSSSRRRSTRRRRRNPSMDLPGLGIAAGVGIAAAGVNYGLEGTTLSNTAQGFGMLGAGAVGGVALSFVSPAAAKAAVAAGVAFGAHKLIKAAVAAKNAGETTTEGLGRMRARPRRIAAPRTGQPAAMLGAVGARVAGRDRMLHPGMGAVGAPLPGRMRRMAA